MTSKLDEWEAEAKDWPHRDIGMIFSKRILTLIDLVRKKDAILAEGIHEKYQDDPGMESYYEKDPMVKALALTEELK